MTAAELTALLEIQALDITLDQIRHRRAHLPARAELDTALGEAKALLARQKPLHDELAGVAREEQRLEDEVAKLDAKIAEVDGTLYSGSVTSPKELQALQADIAMLREQRSKVEDVELDVMERRETLEGELGPVTERLQELRAAVEAAQRSIAAGEQECDAEFDRVGAERATAAGAIDAALLADYDARRAHNNGVGAARLLGDTCQGCRLSIPATEVDQIVHDTSGTRWYCDNCGAILVAAST